MSLQDALDALGKVWSPYKGHLAKKGDQIVYNHGERSHLGVIHSVSPNGIVAEHHRTCCGGEHAGEWHQIKQGDITHIDPKSPKPKAQLVKSEIDKSFSGSHVRDAAWFARPNVMGSGDWKRYEGKGAKHGAEVVYQHGGATHYGRVEHSDEGGLSVHHDFSCCKGERRHLVSHAAVSHIDESGAGKPLGRSFGKDEGHIWDRATSQLVEKGHGGHLFDTGFGQSQDVHGGSRYDEGFRPASASTKHGERHDDFSEHTETTGGHGERYDDWPWRDMPSLHSDRFDTDFKINVEDHGHGSTWYDVFRGGRTAVRYIFDGKDYEGTIISLSTEEATVQSSSGARHEIGLPQILAYATRQGNPHADKKPTAARDVDIKAETAEEADNLVPTHPSPSESASGGRLNANRTTPNVSRLTESIFANKTVVESVVRKGTGLKPHYYVQDNIGKARHVVSFHDGKKTHGDGSPFYDIHIANNKRDLGSFVSGLRSSGYVHRDEMGAVGKSAKSLSAAIDVLKDGAPFRVAKMADAKTRAHYERMAAEAKGPLAHYGAMAAEARAGSCEHCGGKLGELHPGSTPSWTAEYKGGLATCKSCGAIHNGAGQALTHPRVKKSVDSTETSTQSQDIDSKDSKQWCPHCQHTCKSQNQPGICPTCGGRTETGKSLASAINVLKEVA